MRLLQWLMIFESLLFSSLLEWNGQKKLAKIINKLLCKISLLSKKKVKIDMGFRWEISTKDRFTYHWLTYSWFSMPTFFSSIGMKSTKKNGLKKVKRWKPIVKSAPGPPVGMGTRGMVPTKFWQPPYPNQGEGIYWCPHF